MSLGSKRPRGGLAKRQSNTFGKQRTSDRIRAATGVTVNHYTENWSIICDVVKRRDNYTCRCCGVQKLPGEQSDVILTVDHKIPVARGGQTIPSNLHTICIDCHANKKLGSANRRGGKLLNATAKRIRSKRNEK